jgi:hypothetical protein
MQTFPLELDNVLLTFNLDPNLKNELRSNIHMRIKNPEVLNLYGIMKLQLLLYML